ncbi:MAG: hypothetical protein P4L44_14015 [Oryzomonas sp.]|uniref:hypothetical protein n=1 Tax=Oryzomonas sp. TaxID=2855186 RepID=UPI00284D6106|nr:hypothetical protein [Oryzomonas sp.]MDR3581071.1 hypothetical protein [Oryzomonas sp.]
MNKNLFKICFVIALTMCAVSAYACIISTPLVLGGGTFAPSTKVTISVESGGTAYGANSLHSSGDHEYATNSSQPNFWYKTVQPGATIDGASSTTILVSGTWTSM